MANELKEFDISHEMWRKYDWAGRVYTIVKPQKLYIRDGGTTHRVVDADGVVHCVPSVGIMGCVLRWFNGPGRKPVNF